MGRINGRESPRHPNMRSQTLPPQVVLAIRIKSREGDIFSFFEMEEDESAQNQANHDICIVKLSATARYHVGLDLSRSLPC